jgi:hypothetical protein
VRDFNSYPIWVDGVDDSFIEEDLSGTAVGSVRNFAMGGVRTRQRLVAHSDAERFFSYGSCAPLDLNDDACVTRTLLHYQGTLHLKPIIEGDRCFAEWSSKYRCPPEDDAYWIEWWAKSLPTWLTSLRDHLNDQP